MIFRSKHRHNFTLVENAAIRDPRLSLRATGLLAFLLSYPDQTSFSREAVRRMKPDGVRGIRSALIELGQAGYLVHEYERDKWGRWRTQTFIYETPQTDGEAFRPPDEIGARRAGTARAPLARVAPDNPDPNGARRANEVLQNWRVSDGGKRATKYLKNEYQEATTPTDPQGVVAVANGSRPELGLIPDVPAVELIAELRRTLDGHGAPPAAIDVQQELM